MTLKNLNALSPAEASERLRACCGSARWVEETMKGFPFASEAALVQRATAAWYEVCTEGDWREAFTHHPKIGDVDSLKKKFAATGHLAGAEQSGVNDADSGTLEALAAGNTAYEARHGFIFIVCATGKPAGEMLRLLQDRLPNTPEEELRIAAGEQHKITIIRLRKLLDEADWSFLKVSQLTTHVLDTSIGRPGRDITIRLQEPAPAGGWRTIAQGVTNADGRIADLLPPNRVLPAGNYRMAFQTGAYFAQQQLTGFYPAVEIQFTVFDETHYHVPLLVNPFGYSTYRGS
ncbi:2-oxo-4-hydroxy-4-carboxy-5-ureidoimidazoline decarboxylase [Flaviaesturariibacter aridisoli]|uniref:2-oxo-4-hydroxy-4-carboxy-5-ureidoimidazoline decarboxylase n=1 Tax=Flaviaesturariibacter aridisoli TaxID=2545761 RepID=UPI001FB6E267|nr:2-oxo-4-hydroxy-4-carboxy-5-ureidoimidazoline decarboxylase [Flaviaesturariibacter aridisoli]